ncbi:threonine aldolase family protein [Pseudofrankia inefficax]|uniref:Threonine aldolase n=1 Tax=Pseudofrankia inefficax (strain DSM 45817 / CECT 9037 / DDB 130130 / EuI1c) TaxID=298654 RepID=E3J0E7_PSEI1|nr:GntG family PLP-dependent aldolase [Pseudofrankia inefficax]ADP81576.1 Threonine aldolase [Pseudofrankia inefficax]
MTIDLRSDTVTQPTDGMRRAMATAELGDDVYGEDPTVRALEEYGAGLLGHEAALFVPSGTMGNFCALRANAEFGTEILADTEAHVVTYELGGLAVLGGVQTRTLAGLAVDLDLAVIAEQIRPGARTWPTRPEAPEAGHGMVATSVVAVENTWARGGGRIIPVERLERLRAVTDAAEVVLHCDGARLWNAAVGLGVEPSQLGQLFGTLSVCLSKGLGAPVGSLVVGDAAHVARAKVWRKRLGGGMRQAGVLAAAGLYALRHHLDRLADDHRRAAGLAAVLADAAPGRVEPKNVDTNMIFVRVDDAAAFIARAREEGVLVGASGPREVRILTHLDVDDADVRAAGDILARLLAG